MAKTKCPCGRYAPLGEGNNRAKLSAEDVAEIRERYGPPRGKGNPGEPTAVELAKEYGVTRDTILRIVTRRGWTHIPPEKKGVAGEPM